MTIRLTNFMYAIEDPPRPPTSYHIVFIGNRVVAFADTREEAERVKRAFEQVLAPRFTRDEAIAIVKAKANYRTDAYGRQAAHIAGIRLTLEALAAAGVFVDDPRGDHPNDMRDKLDRAGIK